MNKEQLYKLSDILNKFHDYVINTHEIAYTLTTESYDSFKTMINEYKKTNVIKISTVGCTNTVYRHESGNIKFRAVHDYFHIAHSLTFSYLDELKVYEIYKSLFVNWYLFNGYVTTSKKADKIFYLIYLEHVGQQDYFMTNKSFVANQLEWTINKFKGSILCN